MDSDVEPGVYYSPTEQEYDDLEDLRYYDYMMLEEQERWKCVGLLVELLRPMLALLERLVMTAHRHFPFFGTVPDRQIGATQR